MSDNQNWPANKRTIPPGTGPEANVNGFSTSAPSNLTAADIANVSPPQGGTSTVLNSILEDDAIEAEIKAKGLTAPRVTPQRVEEVIAGEYFFTAAEGFEGAMRAEDAPPGTYRYESSLRLLTFCVLVLKNGFTVTGESACASPDNFNAELGRKIARQHAVSKIWQLEGYLLRERLHEQAQRDGG
jgi:hypothetical protein